MRAPETLLDRAALERLERLALRWQQSFRGLLGGANVSRFAGVGHEFLDHRQFHQGDDLRKVNWRAYLRLERLFLMMFRTEPRTPVRVLIDASESMACGGEQAGEAKFPFACRLAAALCYVGLVRLETVILQPFADSLGESLRAGGGRHRYAPAAQFLSGLSTGGKSDFGRVVREFFNRFTTPGLVIVISDFLDDRDPGPALKMLGDEGHELQLIQVASLEDVEPPWDGELELSDAETGRVMRVQLDRSSAAEYAAAYADYCRSIEEWALRSGGRYLHLTTDASIEDALYGAMRKAGSLSLQ